MKNILIGLLLTTFLVSCDNEKQNNNTTGVLKLKPLSSPADSLSAEPFLFTDKKGTVYLSWIDRSEDSSRLMFSLLEGDKWTSPKLIAGGSDWFVNWADFPMLASDGNSKMLAHFLEKSDSSTFAYDVKITSSSDGGISWTAPLSLHDDGKIAEHGFVSIAPYEKGYFISWLDGRNASMEGHEGHDGHHGEMTLRGAHVDESGKKINEWELDARTCDCCQTSTAITANGPVVIYRDRSENEVRDMSIVRLVDGQWTSPQTIYPDNWKISGCPVNGPASAAKGNTLAIAWYSATDKNAQVKLIFSKDGGASFEEPIRIDEGKAIGRVDLVMMDDLSAMVCWMEGAAIKAVQVFANGKKGDTHTIATSTESRSSGFPQMVRSGNGLLFAWTDDNAKSIRVAALNK
ncbi:hypothetical protein MD537_00590 [Flavihumibacter sediminis]|nr:hypothetical protein [Flavihumibacter sediminis]